jgi:Rieske Fe-S protein
MMERVSMERREFLARATCLLGACTGIAALGPPLVALCSPVSGGIVMLGALGEIDLGPLDAFESGVPRRVVIRAARTDAYVREEVERALGSALVVRSGATVSVFTATCPHAGCEVTIASGAFACPCHVSKFSLDGARVSGPSPRDLDRLEARVHEGRVMVRFERFQQGTPDKKAV